MPRFIVLIYIFALSIPLAAQEPGDSALQCPADYAGYLAPRLVAGEWARVLDTPLNFRPIPGTTQARIDQLAPGTTLRVTGGPLCNEGYVWWNVEVDGVAGWLAEGLLENDEYWLQPRGALIAETGADGLERYYVMDGEGFVEPAGCMRPPEDYIREGLGYATLNRRTLAMLDNAQRLYDDLRPNGLVNFRQLIAQGSYNAGEVAASFGTHDAGGAVDISVRSPLDWSVMEDEIPYMIESLRVAGFAAWLRDTGSLYPNSPIHIHAIAVGDAELSEAARLQIDGERGYLRGFNGLPADYAPDPIPDEHGGPVICGWMRRGGWVDVRDLDAAAYAEVGEAAHNRGQYATAIINYNEAVERDPEDAMIQAARGHAFYELALHDAALDDYTRYIDLTGDTNDALINQRIAGIVARNQ